MKKQKFEKKLGLKKTTVVNLNNTDMGNLKGGNLHVSYADPEACGNESYYCSISCSVLIINNICI